MAKPQQRVRRKKLAPIIQVPRPLEQIEFARMGFNGHNLGRFVFGPVFSAHISTNNGAVSLYVLSARHGGNEPIAKYFPKDAPELLQRMAHAHFGAEAFVPPKSIKAGWYLLDWPGHEGPYDSFAVVPIPTVVDHY